MLFRASVFSFSCLVLADICSHDFSLNYTHVCQFEIDVRYKFICNSFSLLCAKRIFLHSRALSSSWVKQNNATLQLKAVF